MFCVFFCILLSGFKNLYVARAQNKEERKQYLQRLHEEKRNEIITKTNVTFIEFHAFYLFVLYHNSCVYNIHLFDLHVSFV
jgi:hypothetical protein